MVKIYQQTKFCRHQRSTYINLWLRYNDFWFGKTNVHHIGIYFRFRSRQFSRNLASISLPNFVQNRSSHCGNMKSYRFIKMTAAQYLSPVSHLLISLPSEGQSLWANQISSRYLNWWLRYNYFRFWKTNVRHIGNLLSVSISTICPISVHYSASGYRISSKSKHPLLKYDVISISQDGGRGGWILLPVSYLLMSLPSVGQSLSANQISSTYLHWQLRYKHFRFLYTNCPPYWNSTSGFDLDQLALICMLYCIRLPNFVQIGAPTAEIWRHIHFSRWRPRPLNTTSGFVLVDVTAFRRSKSISKPTFVKISPLAAEI